LSVDAESTETGKSCGRQSQERVVHAILLGAEIATTKKENDPTGDASSTCRPSGRCGANSAIQTSANSIGSALCQRPQRQLRWALPRDMKAHVSDALRLPKKVSAAPEGGAAHNALR
jgi:hypothetical protein